MFLAILLLSASTAIASVETHDALRLEPDMDQRYASSIATRFLTNYHYKRTRLDDSLSAEIFQGRESSFSPWAVKKGKKTRTVASRAVMKCFFCKAGLRFIILRCRRF